MNDRDTGHEHTGLGAEMKVLLRQPPLLISIAAVFLLFAVFIIYPFVKILLVPSEADWIRAITGKEFILVFAHTLFSSFIATAAAIIFGFLFAYGINYTDMPCKRFFQVVALLPTMAPSVVTGLAFIMLFGRRGFITWQLLHLKVDLYGPFGLWVAQTIAFFPLAYITISGVLKSISPNLELAAQNLGARGWYLFKTVTLRLATPGVASAFLLVAINSLADFGNPMLVGGNYHVLATEAYTQVTGAWDLPMGATLSVFLVIPTLLVFFIQRYYLEKNSYVTVTGKPVAGLIRVTAGPTAKWLLWIFCMLLCLAILMIIGVVILFAFTVAFGYDYTFTLQYFREGVLQSRVMLNSWVASMSTAAITTVLGIALAFLTIRKKFLGRNIMDFLAMLPVSLPGTFIGLALILAFNDGPLAMTGTLAIIILGMSLRQLPVGYRQAVAGLKQIEASLEQASTNLGASSITTFRKIVLPMLKNSLSVSFVYAFMRSMNTLSTVIFLVSPEWNLASINIMSLANQGFLPTASATAVGIMLVIYVTFGVVKLILRDKINILISEKAGNEL
ncbi:iron ABC transporter permease [uncultured Dialister sp.]|mgnify:CR=1 FL=1|uniref:ABC transporter permease n=1 Tax=uncultured Dialister sp. TaxID=278064 RepID=UPI0025CC70F9|nr:iron ABC transporter permease [uncultured Dialister sp.]